MPGSAGGLPWRGTEKKTARVGGPYVLDENRENPAGANAPARV
jgi:hypothetical protein